jgi:nucleoside-diphosphate-sugar epimerase
VRVLVTGHNGYIGTVLAPMLQRAGHEVVGLDSYWFDKDCSLTEGPIGVPSINKDIRDVREEDLDGFDAVIHLAGLCNDPLGDLNPNWTYEINHLASVRLAEMAKARGVKRYLFSSTCSVYGAAGEDMVTEESEPNPVTAYAESKIRVERDVAKLADGDFTPVFLRNATVYGVSPRLRADLVLNNLVGWAFVKGEVLILSDGSPWRPIAHVEDISRAFIYLLEAPQEKVANEVFNVGRTQDNYRVRDLADIVTETVPGCAVKYAEGGQPDKRNYRVSFEKLAKTFPDLRLQWDAKMGAKQVYEAYKANGLTMEDFYGPRLMRVEKLKELLRNGRLDGTLRWTRAYQPAQSQA